MTSRPRGWVGHVEQRRVSVPHQPPPLLRVDEHAVLEVVGAEDVVVVQPGQVLLRQVLPPGVVHPLDAPRPVLGKAEEGQPGALDAAVVAVEGLAVVRGVGILPAMGGC